MRDAINCRLQSFTITNISLNKLRAVCNPFSFTAYERVKYTHIYPFLHEKSHKMTPNKSRPASHEHFHKLGARKRRESTERFYRNGDVQPKRAMLQVV